jgi:hypothetical protein
VCVTVSDDPLKGAMHKGKLAARDGLYVQEGPVRMETNELLMVSTREARATIGIVY